MATLFTNQEWHILHIDDDEEDYLITRDMLTRSEKRKIQVEWAATYEEGRLKLDDAHYDAILVDYDLGEKTGIELINEYAQKYVVPFILFTGRGNREVDLEAMQAGATLYLTKSEVNPLLLERGIRYAIEMKQKENELRHSRQRLERELENRKKVEAALKKSEEKFAKSFRSSPIAIAISTVSDGRFIEVNDRYCALYGFSREELIDHTSIELGLFPNPEDRKEIVRRFREEGGFEGYEIRLRTKSGELKDVLFSTEKIELEGRECMVSMVLDVTERRGLLDALAAQNERLETILQALPVGVWIADQSGRLLQKNVHADVIWAGDAPLVDNLSRYPEYPSWDVETGKRLEAEDYPMVGALRTGQAVQSRELRIQRLDGSEGYVLVSAQPIKDQDGKLVGAVAINLDVTEHKKTEERLREFIENTHDNLIVLDRNWRFAYANRHYCEVMGLNPEDLIGKNYWDLFPKYKGTELEQNYRNVMVTGVPLHYRQGGVYTPKTYDVSVYRTQEGLAIFSIDRTEEMSNRQKLEDERARLEAVLRALQESEARFRDLANNISQFAWMADENGKIFWYNQRWFDYTGTTLEEMQGTGWQKVYHPEHVYRVMEKLKKSFATGETWEDTFPLRGKDGQYRWFLSRAVPIKDENGKVIRWFGTNTDITERMQMENALRESEQKYRQLAETLELERGKLAATIAELPVGVGIGNAQGDFLSLNRAGLSLHGFDSQAEMYTRLERYTEEFMLLHPDGTDLPVEEWPASRAIRGDYVRDEELILRNTRVGMERIVAYTAAPVRNSAGETMQIVYTFQDLTEQKQSEAALRKYAEELERSNQALQDFAFIASHDLQEPLRKVQTFSQILLDRYNQSLETDEVGYLKRIASAAERMSSMVQGLLSYSRVMTEARPFKDVDLKVILKEVLSDLEARVMQTGGKVEVEELPTIQADALQMRQLFQNLLGNGLKFHSPGIAPVVRVSSRKIDQKTIMIRIQDNGTGFDMNGEQRLFEPFTRLHPRSKYEGSGMGLAICKKIVERHNGTISVESRPGEGTTFFITLPIKQ